MPLSGKAVEYSASGGREKLGWSGNQGVKGSYKSIPGAGIQGSESFQPIRRGNGMGRRLGYKIPYPYVKLPK